MKKQSRVRTVVCPMQLVKRSIHNRSIGMINLDSLIKLPGIVFKPKYIQAKQQNDRLQIFKATQKDIFSGVIIQVLSVLPVIAKKCSLAKKSKKERQKKIIDYQLKKNKTKEQIEYIETKVSQAGTESQRMVP